MPKPALASCGEGGDISFCTPRPSMQFIVLGLNRLHDKLPGQCSATNLGKEVLDEYVDMSWLRVVEVRQDLMSPCYIFVVC